MKNPTKKLERQLFKKGYQVVCGLDEVGRGAWAGPIVAAAAATNFQFLRQRRIRLGRTIFNFKVKIRDSKTLNVKQREQAAKWLKKNVSWAIGQVEAWEIDQMGLGPANVLAMKRAVAKLKIKPTYFLVDGPHLGKHFSPGQSIVNGDAKVWCIAAASIIAKVYRDNLMKKTHRKHPQYGFNHHVGYGTKSHQEALDKYGLSPAHRKSFKPIKILKSKV